MWTATIESQNLAKGVLTVGVKYTDGSEILGESHQISSLEALNSTIKSRLDYLNSLSAIVIPIGAYVPTESTQSPDPKVISLNELRRIQDLVALGVLKETDQQVTDAIQLVKSLV